MTSLKKYLPVFLLPILMASSETQYSGWKTLNTINSCTERHENSLAALDGKLLLVGGRGIKPVESYDPQTETWTRMAETPIELSHFQAVTYDDELWVMGAFTGPYPHEVPVPSIFIFNPVSNKWRIGPTIPEDRRRGAAGVVVHDTRIYMVGGETDGHWDGTQAWFDEYDPRTNSWKVLPDAPRARDHISIAVVNNKLFVAGGRVSNAKTDNVINTTIDLVDVYDFESRTWSTLESSANLPTERAGASAVALGTRILVIGGESGTQVPAHSEVEALNVETMSWESFPSLERGRHGTGAVLLNDKVYTVAGSGNRGGGPELTSIEVLE